MKSAPLLSIITVTFNLIEAGREDFFKQCLESVHNQSYKNIEHIIIDGASTDGTVDLIREYAEKGWIKYISEPDSGLYEAMNKGAMLANGDYLAFLNSDDFYNDLEGIEKCINNLVETGADFSYAKSNIIDENGNLKIGHLHIETDFSKVFTDMPFSHQTMIVKTNVFKKLGMYDLKYKSASDYHFVLKMVFNKCSHTMCNCRLVTFRFGGFSIENLEMSYNEVADFYQDFYSAFTKLTHEQAKQIYLTKYLPLKLVFSLNKFLFENEKKEFIKFQLKQKFNLSKIKKSIIRLKISPKEIYLSLFGHDLINIKF